MSTANSPPEGGKTNGGTPNTDIIDSKGESNFVNDPIEKKALRSNEQDEQLNGGSDMERNSNSQNEEYQQESTGKMVQHNPIPHGYGSNVNPAYEMSYPNQTNFPLHNPNMPTGPHGISQRMFSPPGFVSPHSPIHHQNATSNMGYTGQMLPQHQHNPMQSSGWSHMYPANGMALPYQQSPTSIPIYNPTLPTGPQGLPHGMIPSPGFTSPHVPFQHHRATSNFVGQMIPLLPQNPIQNGSWSQMNPANEMAIPYQQLPMNVPMLNSPMPPGPQYAPMNSIQQDNQWNARSEEYPDEYADEYPDENQDENPDETRESPSFGEVSEWTAFKSFAKLANHGRPRNHSRVSCRDYLVSVSCLILLNTIFFRMVLVHLWINMTSHLSFRFRGNSRLTHRMSTISKKARPPLSNHSIHVILFSMVSEYNRHMGIIEARIGLFHPSLIEEVFRSSELDESKIWANAAFFEEYDLVIPRRIIMPVCSGKHFVVAIFECFDESNFVEITIFDSLYGEKSEEYVTDQEAEFIAQKLSNSAVDCVIYRVPKEFTTLQLPLSNDCGLCVLRNVTTFINAPGAGSDFARYLPFRLSSEEVAETRSIYHRFMRKWLYEHITCVAEYDELDDYENAIIEEGDPLPDIYVMKTFNHYDHPKRMLPEFMKPLHHGILSGEEYKLPLNSIGEEPFNLLPTVCRLAPIDGVDEDYSLLQYGERETYIDMNDVLELPHRQFAVDTVHTLRLFIIGNHVICMGPYVAENSVLDVVLDNQKTPNERNPPFIDSRRLYDAVDSSIPNFMQNSEIVVHGCFGKNGTLVFSKVEKVLRRLSSTEIESLTITADTRETTELGKRYQIDPTTQQRWEEIRPRGNIDDEIRSRTTTSKRTEIRCRNLSASRYESVSQYGLQLSLPPRDSPQIVNDEASKFPGETSDGPKPTQPSESFHSDDRPREKPENNKSESPVVPDDSVNYLKTIQPSESLPSDDKLIEKQENASNLSTEAKTAHDIVDKERVKKIKKEEEERKRRDAARERLEIKKRKQEEEKLRKEELRLKSKAQAEKEMKEKAEKEKAEKIAAEQLKEEKKARGERKMKEEMDRQKELSRIAREAKLVGKVAQKEENELLEDLRKETMVQLFRDRFVDYTRNRMLLWNNFLMNPIMDNMSPLSPLSRQIVTFARETAFPFRILPDDDVNSAEFVKNRMECYEEYTSYNINRFFFWQVMVWLKTYRLSINLILRYFVSLGNDETKIRMCETQMIHEIENIENENLDWDLGEIRIELIQGRNLINSLYVENLVQYLNEQWKARRSDSEEDVSPVSRVMFKEWSKNMRNSNHFTWDDAHIFFDQREAEVDSSCPHLNEYKRIWQFLKLQKSMTLLEDFFYYREYARLNQQTHFSDPNSPESYFFFIWFRAEFEPGRYWSSKFSL